MHNWRLLLLAFLATLVPIAQADRLLVYGDRRLLQEQERFCGKEARDTRFTLDGARTEPSVQRERFDARTVNSQDTRRTVAERRSLNRDNQRLTQIRSAEDSRSLNRQFNRARSTERVRELRSANDNPRQDFPQQRLSRDVRQNSLERLQSPNQVRSDRYSIKETQRLTESRRSREVNGNRENDMRRTTRAQSRRETNSRSRSAEMTRRYNMKYREETLRQSDFDIERMASRSQHNDYRMFTHSRSRSSDMTRIERDNINAQRDRELNIRQTSRDSDRISSRSQQDNRFLGNSRERSSATTRRERENIKVRQDREGNIRQSNRDSHSIARSRRSVNRVEYRENNRENNEDGERSSRIAREDRNIVRVQNNDRSNSDAQVRQESLMRTNVRDNKRNVEDRRVRSTERKDFRQMERRMATGLISKQVKFGNWQNPNQKIEIQTQTTSFLAYFLYTLQGLYMCSVLFHLAGIYKSEKKNCGFLQFMISGIGKDMKVN